jgi:hypothetical protein
VILRPERVRRTRKPSNAVAIAEAVVEHRPPTPAAPTSSIGRTFIIRLLLRAPAPRGAAARSRRAGAASAGSGFEARSAGASAATRPTALEPPPASADPLVAVRA